MLIEVEEWVDSTIEDVLVGRGGQDVNIFTSVSALSLPSPPLSNLQSLCLSY